MQAITETNIPNLKKIHQGKVRDIYEIDDEHLLIVATDRLSAFDVILPDPIPQKGAILCQISNFWFKQTKHIISNHCSNLQLNEIIEDKEVLNQIQNHAVIVKRMDNLPVEAIVRGYIIGSGFKDYQKTGSISGITLPANLMLADKLEKPIYTPSTKAKVGDHDENISFSDTVNLLGKDLAKELEDKSIEIYKFAMNYAKDKGIIIADTKFEFGLDKKGDLHLIDEVLTPDSSRFWEATTYQAGKEPQSFDKQFIRNYLETLDWDKNPPGPKIPHDIIEKTQEKYLEAKKRLLS